MTVSYLYVSSSPVRRIAVMLCRLKSRYNVARYFVVSSLYKVLVLQDRVIVSISIIFKSYSERW